MIVPAELPEIGATNQRLVQNPRFDPMKAGFGTEEYFVWSRFDGSTSLRDLILMTGLAIDRAVAIVRRLRSVGAILLPGEPPPAAVVPAPSARSAATTTPAAIGTSPPGASGARRPSTDPLRARANTITPPESVVAPLPELVGLTPDELAAMAEDNDLPTLDRQRILVGQRLVATRDPWVIIGVALGANRRVLKRAYFERSKMFHPDRYFGKRSGSFSARLHEVFEAITNAHHELTNENAGPHGEAQVATAPQTPVEYAAELFDRACAAEVSGEAAQALKLFAATIKLDPQARYLRRAASCALTAGDLRSAEEHAKKAAARDGSDPSTARILARVFLAMGKLDDSEEVLVMALAMKSGNDALGAELASDLKAVRELLRRRSPA